MLGNACVAGDDVGNDGSDEIMDDATDTTDESDGGSDEGIDEGMTGQELYMAFCTACHGPEAEGTNIAYEIRHPHDDFARWIVRNGRTSVEFENQVMPSFSAQAITDSELDRIIEYLDSFAQPATPEGLYLDYCRNCHGADAEGGVVGKPLMNSPLSDFIENTRQGRGGTDYGSRALFMPSRSEDELSDAEIQAIFDYVGTL